MFKLTRAARSFRPSTAPDIFFAEHVEWYEVVATLQGVQLLRGPLSASNAT